jgi:MFS transporter, DHA2 family, multidrug resistance protein
MTADANSEMDSTKRFMLTACVMVATVMQALDTTIANVALPYMQGALSATEDQISWVLTSYIVAAAIMTSPIGWISQRFGRKRLFLFGIIGFTIASMACGLAQTLQQIVLFRLMQGVFGAALVPLSQNVMLDIYPPSQRAWSMALWSMGVILGPIIGPTLGGWLTENYSWRWVFFVNLPVGLLATLGLTIFMPETATKKDVPFAWFGFLTLSLGISALQVMLDRGEDKDWFGSNEIVLEGAIAAVGFYFFFADMFTSKRPFLPLQLFSDWNFSISLIVMFLVGAILLGTMAVVTPFLQDLLEYPVFTSGLLLGSRGLGTFIAMAFVGRLMRIFDSRMLIFVGLGVSAATLWYMVFWSLDTSSYSIVVVSIIQGAGLGLAFAPLNTVAFTTLSATLRTDGTAIYILIRNVGSSIGISLFVAHLTNLSISFHAQINNNITPFNDPLRAPDVASVLPLTTDTGRAMINSLVTQQASVMAYSNDYMIMLFLSVATLPLVFLLRKAKPGSDEGQTLVME